MKDKSFLKFIIISFAIVLYIVIFCEGQTLAEWVMAEGSSQIVGGDIVGAKADALHDAERNAIELALGVMLSSETIVENFALIKDKIFTRVEGYIKDLKILNEVCTKKLCSVKIKADVEKRDLADDIAALVRILPKMNYPSISVAIGQQGLDQHLHGVNVDLATAEATILEKLRKKGFVVVDMNALEKERKRQAMLMAVNGDNFKKAIEEASNGAQILIVGMASYQDVGPSPYNERIHAYSAVINARIFETATGALLGSFTVEGKAPSYSFITGANKALEKAAGILAQRISTELVQVWLDACYNEHRVRLLIEDVPFSALSSIKRTLTSNVKGVKFINQRSFLRGRAEFLIGWQNCNTMRLAERISDISAATWYFEVLEVQGNTLRVAFRNAVH